MNAKRLEHCWYRSEQRAESPHHDAYMRVCSEASLNIALGPTAPVVAAHERVHRVSIVQNYKAPTRARTPLSTLSLTITGVEGA